MSSPRTFPILREIPRQTLRLSLAAAGALALMSCTALPRQEAGADKMQRIKHVVVIYAENHSFDNMYGLFPGANGISRATPEQMTQLDHDGKPLRELVVWGPDGKPNPAFPRMPNKPFRIDAPPVNRPPTTIVPSPIHDYFYNQEQINGGRNNMFAAMSQVGGWVMGHYDGSSFRMWRWAQEYTLADNFFQAAFGGSYLNHQWLICACTPHFPDAPPSMRVRLDAQGKLEKRPDSPSANEGMARIYSAGLGGQVTTDGWSVNTSQPPYQPSGVPPAADGPLSHANPRGGARMGPYDLGWPVPPQAARTIGDTLSAKGVDWAWFSGGWSKALADGMQPAQAKRHVIYERAGDSPNFQAHHQPFNYYKRFAPGTADRDRHIRDGEDFFKAIASGSLPAVSFYKPQGKLNQHPSYTDIMSGDAHIADTLERLRASPQWKDMLIIVTYDENGGYWGPCAAAHGSGLG